LSEPTLKESIILFLIIPSGLFLLAIMLIDLSLSIFLSGVKGLYVMGVPLSFVSFMCGLCLIIIIKNAHKHPQTSLFTFCSIVVSFILLFIYFGTALPKYKFDWVTVSILSFSIGCLLICYDYIFKPNKKINKDT
jgi:hypothetical protein